MQASINELSAVDAVAMGDEITWVPTQGSNVLRTAHHRVFLESYPSGKVCMVSSFLRLLRYVWQTSTSGAHVLLKTLAKFLDQKHYYRFFHTKFRPVVRS